MDTAPRYLMGDALHAAFEASLADWLRSHAPSTSREDAFAGPISTVTITATMLTAGRLNVVVTVLGRRRTEDETYFWRYQRTNGNVFKFTGGTLEL